MLLLYFNLHNQHKIIFKWFIVYNSNFDDTSNRLCHKHIKDLNTILKLKSTWNTWEKETYKKNIIEKQYQNSDLNLNQNIFKNRDDIFIFVIIYSLHKQCIYGTWSSIYVIEGRQLLPILTTTETFSY